MLRQAYDVAFSHLAREVRIWQRLTSEDAPGGTAVSKALERVQRAEDAYRERRNDVVRTMICPSNNPLCEC